MKTITFKIELKKILVLVMFFGAYTVFSQTPDLRTCGYGCTTNSFSINSVFLSDTNVPGITLTNTSCTPGTSQSVYMIAEISSNRNSPVYGARIFADLMVGSNKLLINQYMGTLPSSNSGITQRLVYGPFNWTCGEKLTLENLLVVWKTSVQNAPGANDSYTCNTYTNSQCQFPPDLVVSTPLAVQYSYTACTVGTTALVSFQSTTNGGTPPYTYVWNYDGGVYQEGTAAAPVVLYNIPGTYNPTLKVTDSKGNTNITAYSTTLVFPSQLTNTPSSSDPSCASNDGTGSFTASGGTPPYTFNIVNNTTGASTFINGPPTTVLSYSGAGTGTITVRITDAVGCTATQSITVSAGDNQAPIIVAPADIIVEGCKDTDVTNGNLTSLPYSNVKVTITQAQFLAEGGTFTEDNVDKIEYQDFDSGTCPIVIKRDFFITDKCGQTDLDIQFIRISDTTAPVAPSPPTNISYQCIGDVPAAATLIANDNCSGNISAIGVDTVNSSDPCNIIITRSWTFIDACDNSTSISQTITVADTTPPVFDVPLPGNISVECDAVPTAATLTATDNCGTATVTVSESRTDGSCASNYTLVRTWIATDQCDLTATHTQTITVGDTTPPVFDGTLPGNITVECNAVPTAATLTATDNCGTATVTVSESRTDGSCPSNYTLIRTWTATDLCGLTATHTQTISVGDTTPPVFNGTLPGNITVECNAVPTAATLTANDNCGTATVTVSESRTDGSCPSNYTLIRTWTATDLCGLTATHTQTISVGDTTPPVFNGTLPGNITVECNAVPTAATLTATDNCGTATVTFSESRTDGSCPSNYTLIRTWTATDLCGLTATHTQTISVGDTTPPVFNGTLPGNITVECNAVPITATLTATDNCGTATVTVSETRTDGSCPFNYVLARTWTATDLCGLTTVYTQTVTVQDTTNPILTAPATNIVAECDGTGNSGAIQAWLDTNGGATATDSCGTITWSNNYSGSASDCSAPVSITFTATDECGRTVSTTASYTIQDSLPPVVSGGSDLTVECDGSGNANQLSNWLATQGGASATDDCSAISWTNNYTALSDDCGTTGSANVTFTATDGCGNFAFATFTFTIEDTTAPTIDIAATNLTVECDGNGNVTDLNNWLESQGGASASDACSNVTWTNNFAALSDDCGTTGSSTVTFTATDDCGRTATSTATFTIEDTAAPEIDTNATDLTVECDGNGNVTDLNNWLTSQGGALASDTCSNVTWTNNFTVLSDECGATGSATVTFTATDDCGRTATTSATFTIEDTAAPAIDTNATDLTVECDGNGNVTDLNNWLTSQGGASASDTCSNVTWTNNFTVLSDECGATGSATVTFTATDDCGRTATTSATFTIEDTAAPTIDTNATDLTVECDGNGNVTDLNNWLTSQGGASASDACSNVTWTNTFSALSDDCGATGSATVTFTATDACGNIATSTATFTIEDKINPILEVAATNIVVECDGNGNNGAIEEWLNNNGNASASDACSPNLIWTNNYAGSASDCSAPVSVTFTATDGCGNFVSTTATYSIQDTAPPIITSGSDLTVQCDGNGNIDDLNNWLATQGGATATDNCSAVGWSNNYTTLSDECGATGSATVTFTATDGCGNSVSTTATFTIEDTTPPTIDIVATNLTVECDGNGNVDDLNNWLASQGGASASDVCSNVIWSNNYTSLSDECGSTGSATVTFTATDDCGNISTASATFSIEDSTPPTIDTAATDQTVECDGNGNLEELKVWIDIHGGATASDSCSNVTWTINVGASSDECGATGSTTITFVATDDCGNIATTSATFIIEDTTPPIIDIRPNNLTVECDGNGNVDDLNNWLASQAGASASDSCSDVTWTNNYSELSDSCGATGSASVTFTATDDCGNTATASATFTIEDTTPPTIDFVATNLTVECDGNGNVDDLNNWLASIGGASASDACSNVTWTNNYSDLSEECGATGSASVTFTATDDCGNTATASATFTIEDTTNPTLDIAATNIAVECDGSGNNGAIEDWLSNNGNASASDACSNVTWSNDYSGASSDCSAPVEVTFTATDDCGNFVSTTATYTIQDTVPPVITGVSDLTVQCDGNGNVDDLNNWLANQGGATATDDCSAVTWTNNYSELSDECGATGSATVTFTATDGCGNAITATATFTIEDTTPPTIDIVATNMTVECDGNGNVTDLNNWLASQGGASASDACSNVTWTNNYSELSDECGATGSASVTFTATDDCGNTATASATFTIEDTTPPTIDFVATNLTVECDGNGNVDDLNNWLASIGGASASDACSNVTWTNNYSELSDECGATGSASVTFTATDDCGNTATASATFTIEDTTPPTIDVVATNMTVECDGNGNVDDLNNWLASIGGASASDACSNVTWTNNYSELSDECGATGSASVTFTATDDCGRTATTSATFTIEDTTPPTIDSVATNMTVECDGSGNVDDLNSWLASIGGASASDACSNVTWTNNYSELSDECGATGSASVTFTATDDCGNTATASATFTIEDTTPPTIDFVATNMTVECDGNGNVNDLNNWLASQGGASASDACSNVTWTNNYSALSNTCGATGTASVTFTATDECGNTATASATFTIEDTIAPSIDVAANDLTVECDGSGNANDLTNWLASQGGASASDTCSNVTWTNNYSILSNDCGATGSASVTFMATDDCGNTATVSATFTIEDTTPPTINTPASDLTVQCDGTGNANQLSNWLATQGGAIASDTCSNVTWTNDFTTLTELCSPNTGTATVTFTATDDCGNSSITSAVFTIDDTTAPVIVGNFDAVINVNCAMIPSRPVVVFQDACSSNITVTVVPEVITGDPDSNYQIVWEWIVMDECGNMNNYTQTVNVTVLSSTLTYTANALCTTDIPLELFDVLDSNVDTSGTWVVTSGDATLNGSIFDPASVTDLGNYVFTYSVTPNGQCPINYEVTVGVNDDCIPLACGEEDLIISTTVTPNGDSFNEYFEVKGIDDCGFTVELQIFNRWGAKIYENFNYQNDWNGFASKASIGSSDKVPTGTYYYIINLKNSGLKPFAGPIYVATK